MFKIILLIAAVLAVATAQYILPYYGNYYYGNNYRRAGYYTNYGYPVAYGYYPYAYLYK